MKLILKSYIASKYQDPILDFFHSKGFCLVLYSGNKALIKTREGKSAVVLRYSLESHQIFCSKFYEESSSFLVGNLYTLLIELAKEVSTGDLSKLEELANTYRGLEELFRKEHGYL